MHIAFRFIGGNVKSSSCISILVLIFLVARSPQARAQADSWNIITLAGDTLTNCVLDSIAEATIEVRRGAMHHAIPIDSVGVLIRQGKPAFEKGATMGAVVGAICGTIVGIDAVADKHSSHVNDSNIAGYAAIGEGASSAWTIISSAFIGGAAGALAGGLIGVAAGKPLSYDLSKKDMNEKLLVLRSLTVRHKVISDVSVAR
jgi:hypothetical protein